MFGFGSRGTCLNSLRYVKILANSFSRAISEGNHSYMIFTDFLVDWAMPSTVLEIFVNFVEA